MYMTSYVIKPTMSLVTKQVLINNLGVPKEISMLVKDFVFARINKIPATDRRYEILKTIPKKIYKDSSSVYVFLRTSPYNGYSLYYVKCGTRNDIGIQYTEDRIIMEHRIDICTILNIHYFTLILLNG